MESQGSFLPKSFSSHGGLSGRGNKNNPLCVPVPPFPPQLVTPGSFPSLQHTGHVLLQMTGELGQAEGFFFPWLVFKFQAFTVSTQEGD